MKLPNQREIRQIKNVIVMVLPRKTCIKGSRRHASGQSSLRHQSRPIITSGSRRCAYQTLSRRSAWLNRDPIAEKGGVNLYEFVKDDGINKIDPYGLDCNPTDPDVDGCWASTNPSHLPSPGGPIGGIACEARQYGCLQCCESKHPINGGSSADYESCAASCADNYKRCTAVKK